MIKVKPVTIAIQNHHIRKRFKNFELIDRKGIWRGYLQPFENAQKYRVRIYAPLGKTPKVWVEFPSLHVNAPHVFPKEKNLCLFWPTEWQWSSTDLIAETIVPWVAEWLFNYEYWLLDGKWLSPEAPHILR